MSRKVEVELGERSYDIEIGTGLDLGLTCDGRQGAALVVSDDNVDPLHGDRCEKELTARGLTVHRTVVPAGERTKCQEQVSKLYDTALECGLDRSSCIVALGGGVVGDLAGFVAATFLRGIDFVQVPTTLLAMVDSSVGGKTGINVPQGKNLVGAFYQPVAVSADLDALSTLPPREYGVGLAEVVKYGVISDYDLFKLLEANVSGLLEKDTALLEDVVARCCEIKADVVSRDEKEGGLRAILNFGHTLGHALEKVSEYGVLYHGEAVSIGMVYACDLAVKRGSMSDDERARVVKLLSSLGLPVTAREVTASWPDIRAAMSTDKKSVGSVPRFVVADGIGSAVTGCEVDEDVLEKSFGEISCLR